MIYLDNAATTIQKPKAVAEAVYDAIVSEQYGNPSRGAYPHSLNSLRKLYETRETISKYFGFDDPLKVVLTSNVTIALNYIINSLFDKNDHIITSVTEHNSVLRPLYNLEKQGATLSFLGMDKNFDIELENLESNLKPNTKAVVITGASNVSGKITDLKKVNEFTLKHELKLIVDGAQLAGAIPISLEEYDDIIFAFTGHKSLHGPQGTGGFIVKGDFEFNQVFSGGSGFDSFSKEQPKVLPELFEPGTANLHSFIGLKIAIEELEKDENVYLNLQKNTKLLYDGLREIENLEFYSTFQNQNAPIVSFNIKNVDANEIGEILWDEYSICSRTGSHCAPLFHNAVNTVDRGIVRLSLSSFTTELEILETIKAIKSIANEFSKLS